MDPGTPTAMVPPFTGEEQDQPTQLPTITKPTPLGGSRLPRPVFTPQHLNKAKTTVVQPPVSIPTATDGCENRTSTKRTSSESPPTGVDNRKRAKSEEPAPAPPAKVIAKPANANASRLARPPIRGNRPGASSAAAPSKPAVTTNKPASKPPVTGIANGPKLTVPSTFNFRGTTTSSAQSRPPIKGSTASSRTGPAGRQGTFQERQIAAQMEMLQNQLQDHAEQIEQMKYQRDQMTEKLDFKSEDLEQSRTALTDLRREMREMQQQMDSERQKFREDMEKKQDDIDMKTRECKKLKNKVECLQDELDTYEIQVTNQKTQVQKLEMKVSQLNADCGDSVGQLQQERLKNQAHAKKIEDCEAEIDRLIKKGDWHETERRRLHNVIQELKGNIRVFCRVRPFLPRELKDGNHEANHITYDQDDATKIVVNDSNANTPPVPFTFDMVFGPSSTQGQIFDELSQLVQSALDGYSVCVFAYGQTGSGKTHTMEGPDNYDDESMGMIPRSVRQIFDTAEKQAEKGWTYNFKASMLEIYNEAINDLLYEGKAEAAPKHEIKLVREGSKEVFVSNLIQKEVESPADVAALMEAAHRNRKRAATKCNERSSRSHFVCNIKIQSTNSRTTETLLGSLDLVDLAGSERIKESGSTGVHAKEAFKINGSLKSLGDVIEAIKKGNKHINFRDSKLTMLLQNNFVGSSKTLMFVNISPRAEHANETVNSLRFAAKANNTNIGTAQQKSR